MTKFVTNTAGETEDTTPTAIDFLGQRYGIGDLVVYATTSGRSPVQKLARVENISHDTRTRFSHWETDDSGNRRRVDTQYLYAKVGVREISNGRGFTRYDRYDWVTHTNNAKPARVTYPMSENIVKAGNA